MTFFFNSAILVFFALFFFRRRALTFSAIALSDHVSFFFLTASTFCAGCNAFKALSKAL